MVVGRFMQSLVGYSHLKMLFASYLLLGRNKCEKMFAIGYEHELAKCWSEFSIPLRRTD